jgi:hypothetical protein
MAVAIDPASYLIFSSLVNVDGIAFWELPTFPELLPQTDDLFITIGQSEYGEINDSSEYLRIDLLSNRIYGTPQLWWILALRNNIEVVPSGFKLNDRIVAPSPKYVFQEILPKVAV